MFGCTGTIGETFPKDKIILKIPDLVKNIKYTQNKLIWMKLSRGQLTNTLKKLRIEHSLHQNTFIICIQEL